MLNVLAVIIMMMVVMVMMTGNHRQDPSVLTLVPNILPVSADVHIVLL